MYNNFIFIFYIYMWATYLVPLFNTKKNWVFASSSVLLVIYQSSKMGSADRTKVLWICCNPTTVPYLTPPDKLSLVRPSLVHRMTQKTLWPLAPGIPLLTFCILSPIKWNVIYPKDMLTLKCRIFSSNANFILICQEFFLFYLAQYIYIQVFHS